MNLWFHFAYAPDDEWAIAEVTQNWAEEKLFFPFRGQG